MEKALKLLPLGTSDFENLRHRDQIYVDKTDMICELASVPGKFFFARPRRFGKSLLLSTFESLFRDGLKNFQGLKRQLPAFFYSLPRGSLKTATVA